MVVKHVLDNGVTVLIDEMHDVRSFALGFFVRAGSGDEPAARQGLSHFLEHVLFKRTLRRSNAQIARAIDRLGGDVDAFTTREYTGFYVHTLDTQFAEALDLLGDVVLSPAFEASDVENERGVILEEIGEANDNPDDLAHETFVRSFWKSHPLGAPILGTADTVRAIGRDDLYRYYRSRYSPGNLIVAVAGHVSSAGRPRRARAALPPPPGPGAGAARVAAPPVAPAPGAEDAARARAGPRLPRRRGPVAGERPALRRRPARRRARRRACLRASSRRSARSAASSTRSGPRGTRTGSAATRPSPPPALPGTSRGSSRSTLRELKKLKRGGVRPAELAWAKENLKGNLILALESTVSRMSLAARQEFYFGRIMTPEEWISRLDDGPRRGSGRGGRAPLRRPRPLPLRRRQRRQTPRLGPRPRRRALAGVRSGLCPFGVRSVHPGSGLDFVPAAAL